jgi:hypothetical protein
MIKQLLARFSGSFALFLASAAVAQNVPSSESNSRSEVLDGEVACLSESCK